MSFWREVKSVLRPKPLSVCEHVDKSNPEYYECTYLQSAGRKYIHSGYDYGNIRLDNIRHGVVE
jgi:hypothetical protein